MNWRLNKITGTKETIGKKLDDAKDLPQSFKDIIISEIKAMPGESALVSVTGFSADHAHPAHQSATTRNIQITISSAAI
jgi:hypothetical protein